MQIFAGEYLQDRERASCGCKFLQGSICKIEKEQVVDANFCRGVSARQRKSKLRMHFLGVEYLQDREKVVCGCKFLYINRKKHLQRYLTSRCRYSSSKKKHLQGYLTSQCRYSSSKKIIYKRTI